MPQINDEQAKAILQERAKEIDKVKQAQLGTEYTASGDEQGNVTSLGSSKLVEGKLEKREETRHMAGEIGWKNYPVEYLPSRGMFYSTDMQVTIKPASVQEIRHFSTVEDDDLLDVDEKLSFVLDKCCRVRYGGMPATFKDLLELDRFALVFAIREITFKDGENKLQMNVNCDQCGNSDNIYVTKETFQLFDIHDDLKPYYSTEKRCIVVTGNDGEDIHIYIPTLGVTQFIKNLIRTKAQKKEYYDKSFLKIAPFLFQNWKTITEKTYNQMNDKTFSWNVEKMSKVILGIDLLQNSVTPEINHICSICGAEVKAPISFQGGIKAFFLLSNVFGKLDK